MSGIIQRGAEYYCGTEDIITIAEAGLYLGFTITNPSTMYDYTTMFLKSINNRILQYLNYDYTITPSSGTTRKEWEEFEGDGSYTAQIKYPAQSALTLFYSDTNTNTVATPALSYVELSGSSTPVLNLIPIGYFRRRLRWNSPFIRGTIYSVQYLVVSATSKIYQGATEADLRPLLQWPAAVKQVALEMLQIMLNEGPRTGNALGKKGFLLANPFPNTTAVSEYLELTPRWEALLKQYRYDG